MKEGQKFERCFKRVWDRKQRVWSAGEATHVCFEEGLSTRASKVVVQGDSTNYIAKLYDKGTAFDHGLSQIVAQELAGRFNQKVPPQSVTFAPVFVLELSERPGSPACVVEPAFEGEYVKHSDNCGKVLSQRQTPQAFAHFCVWATDNALAVTDIKGIDNTFTGPQIHTKDGQAYGPLNGGASTIAQVIKSHTCGVVCAIVQLPRLRHGVPAQPWTRDEMERHKRALGIIGGSSSRTGRGTPTLGGRQQQQRSRTPDVTSSRQRTPSPSLRTSQSGSSSQGPLRARSVSPGVDTRKIATDNNTATASKGGASVGGNPSARPSSPLLGVGRSSSPMRSSGRVSPSTTVKGGHSTSTKTSPIAPMTLPGDFGSQLEFQTVASSVEQLRAELEDKKARLNEQIEQHRISSLNRQDHLKKMQHSLTGQASSLALGASVDSASIDGQSSSWQMTLPTLVDALRARERQVEQLQTELTEAQARFGAQIEVHVMSAQHREEEVKQLCEELAEERARCGNREEEFEAALEQQRLWFDDQLAGHQRAEQAREVELHALRQEMGTELEQLRRDLQSQEEGEEVHEAKRLRLELVRAREAHAVEMQELRAAAERRENAMARMEAEMRSLMARRRRRGSGGEEEHREDEVTETKAQTTIELARLGKEKEEAAAMARAARAAVSELIEQKERLGREVAQLAAQREATRSQRSLQLAPAGAAGSGSAMTSSAQSEMRILREQVRGLRDQVTLLNEENDLLRSRDSARAEAESEAIAHSERTSADMVDLRKQMAELDDVRTRVLVEMERELSTARDRVDEQEAEVERLVKELSEARTMSISQGKDDPEHAAALEASRGEAEAALGQVEALCKEVERLRGQMESNEAQSKSMVESKLKESEEKLREANERHDSLLQQLQALEQLLVVSQLKEEEQARTILDLSQELQESRQQQEDVDNKMVDAKQSVGNLQRERDEAVATIETLNIRLKEFESSLSSAKEDLTASEAVAKQLQWEVDAAKGETAEVEQARAKLAADLETVQASVMELQHVATSLGEATGSREATLQSEVARLRATVEEAKLEVASAIAAQRASEAAAAVQSAQEAEAVEQAGQAEAAAIVDAKAAAARADAAEARATDAARLSLEAIERANAAEQRERDLADKVAQIEFALESERRQRHDAESATVQLSERRVQELVLAHADELQRSQLQAEGQALEAAELLQRVQELAAMPRHSKEDECRMLALESELDGLKQQLVHSEETAVKWQASARASEEALMDAVKAHQQVCLERDSCRTKVTELESCVQELDGLLRRTEDEVARLTAETQAAEAHAAASKADADAARGDVEAFELQRQEERDEAEKLAQDLRDELQAAKNHTCDLEEQTEYRGKEHEEVLQLLETRNESIRDLESKIIAMRDDVQKYQTELQTRELAIETEKERVHTVELREETVKRALLKAEDDLTAERKSLKECRQELDDMSLQLQEQRQRLQSALTAKDKEMAAARVAAEMEVRDYEESIRNLQHAVDTADADAEHKIMLEQERRQAATLQATRQMSALQTAAEEACALAERRRDEILSLNAATVAHAAETRSLRVDVEQLRRSESLLQKEVERLRALHDDLKQKLDDTKVHLQSERTRLGDSTEYKSQQIDTDLQCSLLSSKQRELELVMQNLRIVEDDLHASQKENARVTSLCQEQESLIAEKQLEIQGLGRSWSHVTQSVMASPTRTNIRSKARSDVGSPSIDNTPGDVESQVHTSPTQPNNEADMVQETTTSGMSSNMATHTPPVPTQSGLQKLFSTPPPSSPEAVSAYRELMQLEADALFAQHAGKGLDEDREARIIQLRHTLAVRTSRPIVAKSESTEASSAIPFTSPQTKRKITDAPSESQQAISHGDGDNGNDVAPAPLASGPSSEPKLPTSTLPTVAISSSRDPTPTRRPLTTVSHSFPENTTTPTVGTSQHPTMEPSPAGWRPYTPPLASVAGGRDSTSSEEPVWRQIMAGRDIDKGMADIYTRQTALLKSPELLAQREHRYESERRRQHEWEARQNRRIGSQPPKRVSQQPHDSLAATMDMSSILATSPPQHIAIDDLSSPWAGDLSRGGAGTTLIIPPAQTNGASSFAPSSQNLSQQQHPNVPIRHPAAHGDPRLAEVARLRQMLNGVRGKRDTFA